MLHRLCKPPSIPLGFNLAVVVPRRLISRLSSLSEKKTKKNTFMEKKYNVHDATHRETSEKNVKKYLKEGFRKNEKRGIE